VIGHNWAGGDFADEDLGISKTARTPRELFHHGTPTPSAEETKAGTRSTDSKSFVETTAARDREATPS
jgi:hypothetical protein